MRPLKNGNYRIEITKLLDVNTEHVSNVKKSYNRSGIISMKKQNAILRLYTENRKYSFGLIAIFIIASLAGIFRTKAATSWGEVVDFGLNGAYQSMLYSAYIMAGAILLDGIRTAVLYKVIGHVTENMFLDMRSRAFERLNKGDYSVLESTFHTGDTTTRINSDIEGLNTFIAGDISNFLRLIFQGFYGIFACALLSWQLSLAYFIVMPVSIWLAKKISEPIVAQKKKSMDSTGLAANLAHDTISGILTVKSFAMQNTLNRRFGASADIAYEQAVKTEKIGMAMTGIKYITAVIQLMVLFIFGSVLISDGKISVGTLVAFITLSVFVSEPFMQIDYMIRTIRNGTATAQRIFDVLDIPDEQSGQTAPNDIFSSNNEILAQAEDLHFSYGKADVIKGVNLSIKKGMKIALVGPSGCGKSTMIKLLCRFYCPTSGVLKIMNLNINDWDSDSLRENISIVTQDSLLFDGSIYENIAYGRLGTTREQAENALREVGLWDFARSCPGQMDYNVGERGHRLSGGQRQRICIARAMVKNAALVLLDEATSALDTQSEKEVQTALDRLLRDKSSVIVAHRLTTVLSVDYIYCMDKGTVIEEGSPTNLIGKKAYFYDMCLSQGLINSFGEFVQHTEGEK